MSLKDKVEHLSKVKASLQDLRHEIEVNEKGQQLHIRAHDDRINKIYKKLKGGKIVNCERACKCKAHLNRLSRVQKAQKYIAQPQTAQSMLPSITKRDSMKRLTSGSPLLQNSKTQHQGGEYSIQSRGSSLSSINHSLALLNNNSNIGMNGVVLKSSSDILNLHSQGSIYGRNNGRFHNLDTSYRVEKSNSLNEQLARLGGSGVVRERDLIARI